MPGKSLSVGADLESPVSVVPRARQARCRKAPEAPKAPEARQAPEALKGREATG